MGHVSEVASNAWDFARVIVGGKKLGHRLPVVFVIETVDNPQQRPCTILGGVV
jgi:hypothetical protein